VAATINPMAVQRGPGQLTWREATELALYGPDGFFRRNHPADHFRTAVHASPIIAEAMLGLARDAGLDTVVDVGAGDGDLLADLHHLDPDLHLLGVELAPRPSALPGSIGWAHEMPADMTALVVGHEWLDDVPLDVVERTKLGRRTVLVDPSTGDESTGPHPTVEDLDWLDTWWPQQPGERAEVGRPRDEAWASVISAVRRGVAVAVDYAHERNARPPAGSLTGYRDGRQVPPVPDGSCDVTSHVALDACAAAGEKAGAVWTVLTSQRTALEVLGVRRPRPPRELAHDDPPAYVRALSAVGELAELTDPHGLGAFGWLVQGVGVPTPQRLTGTDE
jgi:SAM-dependent MidA family methyltransferase